MLKRQPGLKSVHTPHSERGISMPAGKNRKKTKQKRKKNTRKNEKKK